MIDLRNVYPKNKAHFVELLAFGRDVLSLCHDLNLEPVLSGSLAVLAYTRDPNLEVHDLDLACPEAAFPVLSEALSARGYVCRLKAWHVLQVHRAHLKVEFDAEEYWLQDLPEADGTLVLAGTALRMVGLASLTELYRRGLEATATEDGAAGRAKHKAVREKYRVLRRLVAR